jgi:hypothetical protein
MLLYVSHQLKAEGVRNVYLTDSYTARLAYAADASPVSCLESLSRGRVAPVAIPLCALSLGLFVAIASFAPTVAEAQTLAGVTPANDLQAMTTRVSAQGGFESALSVANGQSVSLLGQTLPSTQGSASFRIGASSILNGAVPALSIARNVEETGFEGAVVEEALNFNLGVAVEPLDGLSVSADAWRLEVNESTAQASLGRDWRPRASNLYIQDSKINEFNVDNPLVGSQLETNGFDLSASYVWDTSRFGQFTLSTKSTYVQDFDNTGALLELGSEEMGALDDRLVSPELQSSMMLSWQFGNHTATAITNYFDSFKDISELDLDEINDLVDNITTFDLQYGYSVKTGAKDRAIISFGIRNLFDEKTAQILNSSTRLLDQNGRVAYGSIKYQF